MTAREPKREPCRSCRSEVIWGTDANTRSLTLIDADPSPNGNVSLYVDDKGGAHFVVLNPLKAAAMRAAKQSLYLSHFASCPQAANWRKGRR
ncbi:hypothetical protein [Gordonia malaquae]|uniref:hypothetical protein n=1 Tax=Gordonia malaquae TaxID=410332 RepID=UPI003019138B